MKTSLLLLSLSSFLITSAFAQKTYVPDDKFEEKLIELGFDSGVLDDSVLTATIDTVIYLDLDLAEISDLTGIEAFDSLKILDCSFNNLTNVDLSNNTRLEKIDFFFNDLVSINLSNNSELWGIDLGQNELENLDLTNNPNITHLDIGYNSLSELDLSQNVLLTYLTCRENDIESLDLTNQANIKIFYCEKNQLSQLNIKNGNNAMIEKFRMDENPDLFCVEVDDPSFSNVNWPSQMFSDYFYDNQIEFSSDCSSIGLEENNIKSNIDIFYSTSNSNINVQSMLNGQYKFYSTQGKALLLKGKIMEGSNQINLSDFSKGMYFIEVSTNDGSTFIEKISK